MAEHGRSSDRYIPFGRGDNKPARLCVTNILLGPIPGLPVVYSAPEKHAPKPIKLGQSRSLLSETQLKAVKAQTKAPGQTRTALAPKRSELVSAQKSVFETRPITVDAKASAGKPAAVHGTKLPVQTTAQKQCKEARTKSSVRNRAGNKKKSEPSREPKWQAKRAALDAIHKRPKHGSKTTEEQDQTNVVSSTPLNHGNTYLESRHGCFDTLNLFNPVKALHNTITNLGPQHRSHDKIYSIEDKHKNVSAEEVVQSGDEELIDTVTQLNTSANRGDPSTRPPKKPKTERRKNTKPKVRRLTEEEKRALEESYAQASAIDSKGGIQKMHCAHNYPYHGPDPHVCASVFLPKLPENGNMDDEVSRRGQKSRAKEAVKEMKRRHQESLLQATFFHDDSDSSCDEDERRPLKTGDIIEKPKRTTKPGKDKPSDYREGKAGQEMKDADSDSSESSSSSSKDSSSSEEPFSHVSSDEDGGDNESSSSGASANDSSGSSSGSGANSSSSEEESSSSDDQSSGSISSDVASRASVDAKNLNPWTEDFDRALVDLKNDFPNCSWAEIAEKMPGAAIHNWTKNGCKKRHQYLMKQRKKENTDSKSSKGDSKTESSVNKATTTGGCDEASKCANTSKETGDDRKDSIFGSLDWVADVAQSCGQSEPEPTDNVGPDNKESVGGDDPTDSEKNKDKPDKSAKKNKKEQQGRKTSNKKQQVKNNSHANSLSKAAEKEEPAEATATGNMHTKHPPGNLHPFTVPEHHVAYRHPTGPYTRPEEPPPPAMMPSPSDFPLKSYFSPSSYGCPCPYPPPPLPYPYSYPSPPPPPPPHAALLHPYPIPASYARPTTLLPQNSLPSRQVVEDDQYGYTKLFKQHYAPDLDIKPDGRLNKRECEVLAIIDKKSKVNKWLEMQAQMWNATGRCIEWQILKAKVEEAEKKFPHQEENDGDEEGGEGPG